MDAPSAARVKEWLRANRGDETQDKLAADITKVTGWHITRDRYSKYEGALPIGRKVLAHFVDYWATRGRPGPFDALPEPATSTEPPDPLIVALTAQTKAINDLVAEIQREREDGHDVATAFDRAATHLLQVLRPGGSGGSGVPHAPDETEE